MFEKEWMEYFQREAPFSYYCILFLQFLVTILSYFAYIVLLMVLLMPVFMIYSGTKSIKIKLVKNKKLQKEKEQQEKAYENLYLDHLDKNLKKKKKNN